MSSIVIALPVDGSSVTQPVSGTVTANQGVPNSIANSWSVEMTDGTNILGTSAHPVQTLTAIAATATITTPAVLNNTDTQILASNANRKSAIIFVPQNATRLKYGAGASLTSFTWNTGAANTTIQVVGYSGPVNAFGAAQTYNVTELT